ncbi:MAG: hypothetical protein M3464_09770 [Chloroflexota bacterium]|nr:hypothetical protein [Chloroflexota bacterium]
MRLMEGVEVTKTPRIKAALAELQQMIAERYPTATFSDSIGTDPIGFYLDATVDIDDTDEVWELIVDRLVDIQVEDELPIHVSLHQTPEREKEAWREYLAARAAAKEREARVSRAVTAALALPD